MTVLSKEDELISKLIHSLLKKIPEGLLRGYERNQHMGMSASAEGFKNNLKIPISVNARAV